MNLVLVPVGDRLVGHNLTEMNESGVFDVTIRIINHCMMFSLCFCRCSDVMVFNVMCELKHGLEKVPN